MVIENFFIHYHKPAQYLYWGENYLDVYGTPGPGKTIKKIKTFNNITLLDTTPTLFQPIARELTVLDTGVMLNSGNFIFNIFEFDKLPFQEKLKQELVEWRLKKVFPENIDEYEHHFYPLKKTSVLSILIKKSIKVKIQHLFQENNIPLIYIGNSTVEIINYMTKAGKSAPDFFIEIDKNITIVVFQELGLPYYIRKFRSDQAQDLVGEIIKTTNFVKSSYAKIPVSYAITADRLHSDLDFNLIHDELAKLKFISRDIKDRDQLFFSGKKR